MKQRSIVDELILPRRVAMEVAQAYPRDDETEKEPDWCEDYEVQPEIVSVQLPVKLKGLWQPKRFKVMYGGRGGAKSWSVAMALLIMGTQRPLRILCAREIQKSMKDSVHRLLSDQITKLGFDGFYEVLDTEIRGANGTLIFFAGLQTHTVNSVKSAESVDIVWIEEAQTVSAKSWEVLVPTIRKPGSEIWLTFNPDQEQDATWQQFVVAANDEDFWICEINWRDNPWFPDVLEKERQRHFKRDQDSYWRVWEGQPSRVAMGAIYAKEVERLYQDRRVCRVNYDPRLPVHTVWDLGWADYMAIMLVQRTHQDFRCIGYYQDSHRTIEDWIVQLKDEWNVAWGTDFLPHDARAGDYKSGTTAEQIAIDMGRDVQVLKAISIEGGIRVARSLFSYAYIDEEECATFLECMKRYKRQIDLRTGLPGAPLHDDASHGADVWRYLGQAVPLMQNAQGDQQASAMKRRNKARPSPMAT